MNLIGVISFIVFLTPAVWGLSGGFEPPTSAHLVRIRSEVLQFVPQIGEMRIFDSNCSGVVVGTKPLTVLTASHCFANAPVYGEVQLPKVDISIDGIDLSGKELKLKNIAANSGKAVRRNIALDVAVVIFENDDIEVNALPIAASRLSNRVKVCGTMKEHEFHAVNPKCMDKTLVSDNTDFSQLFPASYSQFSQSLYQSTQNQVAFNQRSLQSNDQNTLIIDRIDAEGYFSSAEPMILNGDSGGPWLQENANGELEVVAVTSLTELFPFSVQEIDFFKDKELADLAFAAYGARLDTPEALAVFAEARTMGADLTIR